MAYGFDYLMANHDSDIFNLLGKSQVADLYAKEGNEFCLFQRGPEEVDGYGNHIINIKNTRNLITKSLIMLDTNSYIAEDPLGIRWIYDNIHENQIEWYERTVKSINAYNEAIINAIPEGERSEELSKFTSKSLLFTHIPMTEVKDAWMEFLDNEKVDTENVKYLGGKMGKAYPYVNSPKYDDNMFETILRLGSTEAVFFGHDHDNNVVLEYKGVKLSYNYSVDYYAYPGIENMTEQRGCSIITFEGVGEAKISHEKYTQEKYLVN